MTATPDQPTLPPLDVSPGGFTSAPPPAPLVVVPPGGTRFLDTVVVGVAGAAIAGVLWWAVTAYSQRQFPYLAVLLGVLVGQAVLVGARRGGMGPALVAGALALVALAVAQYFIERSLAIAELGVDVPLWQGFGLARDVVRESVEDDPVRGLFWGRAASAAAVSAGSRTRRPLF